MSRAYISAALGALLALTSSQSFGATSFSALSTEVTAAGNPGGLSAFVVAAETACGAGGSAAACALALNSLLDQVAAAGLSSTLARSVTELVSTVSTSSSLSTEDLAALSGKIATINNDNPTGAVEATPTPTPTQSRDPVGSSSGATDPTASPGA